MRTPEISVILCTYNRCHCLPAAVKSIRAQTYRNFEVIIVNDGSTDRTRSFLERLSDVRIRSFHQTHRGLAATRNTALDHVRGTYISYLDDDDRYYPHHLRTLHTFLTRHPDIDMVYGTGDFRTGKRVLPGYSIPFSKKMLEVDNIVPGNLSVMHRTRCIESAGGFTPSLGYGEDWELWLRIADTGKIAHLSVPVGCITNQGVRITTHTKSTFDAYMKIILLRQKNRHGPLFCGYTPAVFYRLIYKFHAPSHVTLRYAHDFIKRTNGHPDALFALGLSHIAFGRREEAAKALRQTVRAAQKKAKHRTYVMSACRVLAYLAAKKHARLTARAYLRKALDCSPHPGKTEKADDFPSLFQLTTLFLEAFSQRGKTL